jgi:hypothetical protein
VVRRLVKATITNTQKQATMIDSNLVLDLHESKATCLIKKRIMVLQEIEIEMPFLPREIHTPVVPQEILAMATENDRTHLETPSLPDLVP